MNKYLEKVALLLTQWQHDETGRTTWTKDKEPGPGERWFKTGRQAYKKRRVR